MTAADVLAGRFTREFSRKSDANAQAREIRRLGFRVEVVRKSRMSASAAPVMIVYYRVVVG